MARTYKGARGELMPYRLFVPTGYDRKKRYPLLLWLHGGAGRGNDNLKQISGGNTSGSQVWTKPENQSVHPCFVVAPQCPENALWATLDRAESTEQLRLVLELIENLRKTFSIDEGRLYVAGQSMGGFGAWSLISEYQGVFAAAVPVCGGGDVSKAAKLVNTPVWAFHGEEDAAVSVARSRNMIAALRKAGGKPKYTEYKGVGHNSWERAFGESELLTWVFAQRTESNSPAENDRSKSRTQQDNY